MTSTPMLAPRRIAQLLLATLAGCGPADDVEGDFLWKLEGKPTAWPFGTMHTLQARHVPAAAQKAFEASSVLVVELDVGTIDVAAYSQRALLPLGPSLQDLLTADEWDKLRVWTSQRAPESTLRAVQPRYAYGPLMSGAAPPPHRPATAPPAAADAASAAGSSRTTARSTPLHRGVSPHSPTSSPSAAAAATPPSPTASRRPPSLNSHNRWWVPEPTRHPNFAERGPGQAQSVLALILHWC